MDLRITITDENGDRLGVTTVYQDGSDSEGTDQILDYIHDNFVTEGADVQYGPEITTQEAIDHFKKLNREKS